MFIKMTRNLFFLSRILKDTKTRIFHILTSKDDILTRLTVQIVDRCKLFLQTSNRRFVILNYNRIKLQCSLFKKIDFLVYPIFLRPSDLYYLLFCLMPNYYTVAFLKVVIPFQYSKKPGLIQLDILWFPVIHSKLLERLFK